uniref:AIG1-type G domain-containing protein n=1 Tax=Amphimedon queenslandica TaxID=400682 RepID=A0A1X7VQ85_AMPQE
MSNKWSDADDNLYEEIDEVSPPNEGQPIEEPPATLLHKKYKKKLGKKDVHILLTGLSGAGKSTLANAMLGETVALTGCGPDSVEASKSYHEGEFEGVKLQVCDTNGYSESNREIPESDGFNLILLCIKITNRVGDSEVNLLQALGEAFDKEAWSRTVIVLTFANFLTQDAKIELLKTEEEKCQAIKEVMEEYKESITKHLRGYMNNRKVRKIPFCLAGKSDLSDPTNRDARKLLTTEDWLVDLWEISAKRSKPLRGQKWYNRLFAFIKKTFSRREEQKQHVEEKQVEEVQKVEIEERS